MMQKLKTVITEEIRTLTLLGIAIIFSCSSLLLRIKLNKSVFYIFLIWNLFLAIIPYFITMYLNTKKQVSKFHLIVFGGVWLLFLPNAPYIITDFVHLKNSNDYLWWLDILVLLSFGLTGLYLFYKSLNQMEILLIQVLKKWHLKLIRNALFFLCGFGIYLGRFLRYNSWEILSQPKQIISDILNIIIQPLQHKEAWLFTFSFGLFLWLGYCGFKTIKRS